MESGVQTVADQVVEYQANGRAATGIHRLSVVGEGATVGTAPVLYAPKRWPIVVAAVAYWTGLELRAFIQDSAAGTVTRFNEIPSELLLVASGSLLSIAIYAGLKRCAAVGLARQIAAAAVATLLACMAQAAAVRVIFNILPPFIFAEYPLTPSWFAAETVFWFGHFGTWAAFLVALTNSQQARRRENEIAATRAMAQDAQLLALRYQINPHFLFNTLNSISTLVWEGDNEAAKRMIIALSDFFRATLEIDPAKDIRLEDEIALQRLYLDIELVRFANNLTVDIDLPDELADIRVPSLVLQPLVENAIKYGVTTRATTILRIAASRQGNRVRIEVSNQGGSNGAAPAGTGIGLRNVAKRLAARYGNDGRLETSSAGDRFSAILDVPLR